MEPIIFVYVFLWWLSGFMAAGWSFEWYIWDDIKIITMCCVIGIAGPLCFVEAYKIRHLDESDEP